MQRSKVLITLILLCSSHFANAICFVDASAPAHGDGNSWNTAFNDLQSALVASSCVEIHVAAGVYKPGNAGDIDATFNVLPRTELLGGYKGRRSTNPDDRDPWKFVSVLSGDIDDNDATDGNGVDETSYDIRGHNSRQIVTFTGTPASSIKPDTLLDGFAITGVNTLPYGGSAISCTSKGAGSTCSPTIKQILVSGNIGSGIGVRADDAGYVGLTVANCRFTGNHAGGGGAISQTAYDENAASVSTVFSDCTFDHNWADGDGGVVFNYVGGASQVQISIQNSTIFANFAFGTGAIIFDAAALSSSASLGVLLGNVTAFGNSSLGYNDRGSAIDSIIYGLFSSILITDSILWDVDTTGYPDTQSEFDVYGTQLDVDHSILRGGCSGTFDSCIKVVNADPMLGAFLNYGGAQPTLLPSESSPAIDGGNPSHCKIADERGVPRPQGTTCDIGALERQKIENEIFQSGFDEIVI